MTAPTTEEKRKGKDRRKAAFPAGANYARLTELPLPFSHVVGHRISGDTRTTTADRRATERERQQKHYGAMLEDSRDMVDARRYRWLMSAFEEYIRTKNSRAFGVFYKSKSASDIDAAIDAEILKGAKP